MTDFESFEKSRESLCTDEVETVACEYCDGEFERPIESEYVACSKSCFRNLCAEFRNDI
tara:strand:+ start:34841 stop:35017 length:177 start_codon:yes stop_codon:yes gene_type:complete